MAQNDLVRDPTSLGAGQNKDAMNVTSIVLYAFTWSLPPSLNSCLELVVKPRRPCNPTSAVFNSKCKLSAVVTFL
jgi:hypothetical protein